MLDHDREADAVVIGSGPNGLVAASMLADAGWDVVLLEATGRLGGAVASGEITAPGFTSDLFSAFYPLGAASPAITALGLADHGLEWVHAPLVLAHPLPDGRSVVLSRDLEETLASVGSFAPADARRWRELVQEWERIGPDVVSALLSPFPPVRAGVRLLRELGAAGTAAMAERALTPVRRFAVDEFEGDGARLLLAGNALHADLPPESPGSAIFGWLLAMLGQEVGFPVPRGGAGQLAAALAARARSAGAELVTDAEVTEVVVRGGRALGVRTAGGAVRARRAVLADVPAPTLFGSLVPRDVLPPAMQARLDRFPWDDATLKVDWALSAPVPWTAEGPRRAGTVHVGADLDGLTRWSADLATGELPREPFLLVGQMTTTDASRSPAGTEAMWAYTHLPRRLAGDAGAVAELVERVEAVLEAYAPGFSSRVLARHVADPRWLEAANPSLVGGAVNGGTAALHHQLVLRPWRGLARAETPVDRLLLASSAAHPGGGVHGACGANAARAALLAGGPLGRGVAAALRATLRALNA